MNLLFCYQEHRLIPQLVGMAHADSVTLWPTGRIHSHVSVSGHDYISRHTQALPFAGYDPERLPRFETERGGVLVSAGERPLERAAVFAVRVEKSRHLLYALGKQERLVAVAEGPRTWRLADGRRAGSLTFTTVASSLPLRQPRGRASALAARP